MSDELWNQKLTRENIRDFYMSTVVMVYSSCYGITKEATRCENAIVKYPNDIIATSAVYHRFYCGDNTPSLICLVYFHSIGKHL